LSIDRLGRTAGLALLLAGCATGGAGGAAAGPGAATEAVPVPEGYRAALEAGTRSATGAPGPRYWQQGVSYRIEARLEPRTTRLSGSERVVYRNRSPDTLTSLVLNLYQNVYSAGVPRNRFVPITGGITLERVAVAGRALEEVPAARLSVTSERRGAEAGYAVQGTLARLVLPAPIPPGDSVALEVAWHFDVPPAPTFRTAWEDALGARVLQVAQWYPQVAVYDDVRGWDATPYLGDGEFYLEYGDFDVALTLPAGWLVGATGELTNAAEVLGDSALARLARARGADGVVRVVGAGERGTRAASGPVTWRFRAEDVRDFAFSASDGYAWDATRADAGDGRPVLVSALYRPGAPHWEEAASFGKHAIEFHGREIVPYLYPQVTIAEGPIGGMEYPMLVFISRPSEARALYSVITHEVGHEWFPMAVGSDEARYAWMDEGIDTYWEDLAVEDRYPGTDAFAGDLRSYLAVAGTEREVPLMRPTDLVSPYGARTVAAYTKPAIALRELRGLIGAETFRRAMTTYAREWTLKHPQPWDFFHTFERVSGRDLDGFWERWFYETPPPDPSLSRAAGR
jgi:hypothetical protein